MGRLFGTDGIRGLANSDLTPELALGIAASAAEVLTEQAVDRHPVAVVGRDPRASGEMLEAAVVAGLTSAGARVIRVGVLPTPAVAYLTAALDADLGVMLSASHNPMPDNGIKLFARGGRKLPDAVEDAIESGRDDRGDRPIGAAIGRVTNLDDGHERYVRHLLETIGGVSLSGLRIAVDCANGAASAVAPDVYRRAGASVEAIHAAPDGVNINSGCGSTHIDGLVSVVRSGGFDLGIAHDGDADRCLAVSGDGEIVDGDGILGVCALALRDAGRLRHDGVVATVMSNLGFHHAMRDVGISVVQTPVGDRYVLEALASHDLVLGGEQSGHLVFTDFATTGDGVLTALQLMARVAGSGESLAKLASVVRRLPQVLINVTVEDRAHVAASQSVAAAVAEAEAELGDDGRVVLRPSGTEQLVRVMVEAPTDAQADALARRIAAVVTDPSR